ncbi:hypothetical protein AJ79_04567 [Helicocarpus griseus UAMH5409]|uniref:Uncharacterized protein n=1 Tax=Helicocarpus griseus UAMH5409 TaxID=1447875 RepID=A0A2B7XSL6_9EURO|nr:hypothetical protein AJ79_04567 [Helicocarpus griseus UAMH5409]
MGQKHNRRRTRPRSRHRRNAPPDQNTPQALASITSRQPCYDIKSSNLPSFAPYPYPLQGTQPAPLAQQWHNRYVAWQNHERRQQQEAAKLEAEQFRLFGGEPGDDVALCYRMLEYFGGLDYIDS